MSLKNILFQEYAEKGLNEHLKSLQKKYKPKKGRRFNENNITYEIGIPKAADNSLEFEVSSKIPQDELKGKEGMKEYFEATKKLLLKSEHKPVFVKMENITWDADKDTEKDRDYVKVAYRVNFEDLYSEEELVKQAEKVRKNPEKHNLPQIPGINSLQGRLLLLALKGNFIAKGNETITSFMEANDKARMKLCNPRK